MKIMRFCDELVLNMSETLRLDSPLDSYLVNKKGSAASKHVNETFPLTSMDG